jgi:hypothetical protein
MYKQQAILKTRARHISRIIVVVICKINIGRSTIFSMNDTTSYGELEVEILIFISALRRR